MSREEFNDDCVGCRPTLIEPSTGKVLPADDPIMKAIHHLWDTDTTRAERAAWHAVVCLNSREPAHIFLVAQIHRKMEALKR